jgi:hypothetical protein
LSNSILTLLEAGKNAAPAGAAPTAHEKTRPPV